MYNVMLVCKVLFVKVFVPIAFLFTNFETKIKKKKKKKKKNSIYSDTSYFNYSKHTFF
jgi:hypothetical protein